VASTAHTDAMATCGPGAVVTGSVHLSPCSMASYRKHNSCSVPAKRSPHELVQPKNIAATKVNVPRLTRNSVSELTPPSTQLFIQII
jgi:hypothetical protein